MLKIYNGTRKAGGLKKGTSTVWMILFSTQFEAHEGPS